MKKLSILVVATLLFSLFASAQSPQSIPFQAVARDSNGVLLPMQNISVRITIHGAPPLSPTVYKETQSVTTNNLGLFTLSIGLGTPVVDTFHNINWGSGPKFVQIEIDPTGGTSYINMGTSQLQSVPYALYALNSGNTTGWQLNGGALSEIDTTFNVGIGTSAATSNLTVVGNVSAQQNYSDNNGGSILTHDSTGLFVLAQADNSSIVSALCVGDGSNILGPDAPHIAALVGHDGSNNILYGLLSMPDSAMLLAQDKSLHMLGMVGVYDYSAYMDVRYGVGNTLNSLTIDSNGLHYEYDDTDLYTFPNTAGHSGQVLSTDGSGHLAWSSVSAGTTLPSKQIGYSNSGGTAIVGDANFTRDSLTQKTHIICQPVGANYTSGMTIDSSGAGLSLFDGNTGYVNLLHAGYEAEFHFGRNTVVAATIDGSGNVMHGFYALRDSTEMITTALDSNGNFSNSTYYGLAGTQAYSAYFDVLYNNGGSLNSLTADSNGLHWEYKDTDRYTFPNVDGGSGQVISTDGSGHLNWVSAGGARPTGQIGYGNGTSMTGDGNFTHDSSSGTTFIKAMPSLAGSEFEVDSDDILLLHANAAHNLFSVLQVGNASHPLGLDTLTVVAAVIDANNNILYGFSAVVDSVQMITSDGENDFGVVGTQRYSSYMDVGFEGGTTVNSLTVDTAGLHWEYRGVDICTFPNSAGSPGQVLQVNPLGGLSFSSLPSTATAWNAHQILPGTGSTSDTITLANNENNIYNPGIPVTITSLLINLPSSPNDGDMFVLTLNATVVSINFQNGTVSTAVAGIAASLHQNTYTYDAATSTWY